MRTLKSTMDKNWDTLYKLKLKDCPEELWYGFIYEQTVCAGINLIDFYTHILDNYTIPGVLFDKLTSTTKALREFYGE